MAASLLRIGRLRFVNQCLQAESLNMLSRAPTVLSFSTKSGGSKNSSKKPNKDKSKPKTYFDIEKLVQHKPYNFPKKEVSPIASAVAEVAPEATASVVIKHNPPVASPETVAANYDIKAEPVTTTVVEEVLSKTTTSEPIVEVFPEAFPGEATLITEASEVAAGPMRKAAPVVDFPQVPMHPALAPVEAAPDPFVEAVVVEEALNLVHEAVTKAASAEGSLKPVAEAASAEASLEPVAEVSPAEASLGPVAEVSPAEASLEPVAEATPVEASLGAVAEKSPAEVSLEPEAEAAPAEVSLEAVAEAAPAEASLEPVAEAAPAEASLEPVSEASLSEPDLTETMPEPEAEVALEPVATIAEATDGISGDEELVDPGRVPSKAAEEELQMDSPAEAVEPSQAHMDPVQRLFLDSIRKYSAKSQATGGLVDAGSQYEKVLEEEIVKLQRLYGGGDLSRFPNFKFTEPQWDEVSQK